MKLDLLHKIKRMHHILKIMKIMKIDNRKFRLSQTIKKIPKNNSGQNIGSFHLISKVPRNKVQALI